MRNIVILGGGISGLSLLWYLKKKHEDKVSLTLLEKTSRVGGWINTIKKDGFLFERGPRSCRTKGIGQITLQLIEELGLQNQVITPSRSAHQRYLYLSQQLQKVPASLPSLLFSSLGRKIVSSLLLEWRAAKGVGEDESIYAFFTRRLGREFTEIFLDALTSGIYAGNIQELSMKSCFPRLFEWERQYGCLLKGALVSLFSGEKKEASPFVKKMSQASLFSLKEGMESLPIALAKQLETHIFTNHAATSLKFKNQGIDIVLNNGKVLEADQVYSTLPAYALSALIRPHQQQAAEILNSITASSLAVVSLGYKKKLLPWQGFGYLVPSKEKEDILGVVWDSCVFPEQNASAEETRLTVMIGGTHFPHFFQWNQSDFLNCAIAAVSNHLHIKVEPDAIDVHLAEAAIPQYQVGHEQKKRTLSSSLYKISPHLNVLGSSFNGVAISECIAHSKEAASNSY